MPKKTTSTPPCHRCNALCCRHIAIQIDKPTCKRDYDNIRWYLLHKNVQVMVDHDNDWLVCFVTDCIKITPDNQCAAYEERPRICAQYPPADASCEFETDEPPHKLAFASVEEFDRYLENKKRVRRE